jgi:UDP-N-acetyl-D-mannosaminuronate dehydrogenase
MMHLCFPFRQSDEFETIALSYIERFKPALTIINSTVVPGTTRAIAQRAKAPVAYSPVRGKHVHMVADLTRYHKFVAATDLESAQRAEEHFREAGLTTRRIGRLETLELAKLAETTYFGMLIAFAQELNRYAGRVKGDYDETVTFFEEVEFLPRPRYFPGLIGGHCVMPNTHLLLQVADSPLLRAIIESNARRARELDVVPTAQESANGAGELPGGRSREV